jgi:hypothetical protein
VIQPFEQQLLCVVVTSSRLFHAVVKLQQLEALPQLKLLRLRQRLQVLQVALRLQHLRDEFFRRFQFP